MPKPPGSENVNNFQHGCRIRLKEKPLKIGGFVRLPQATAPTPWGQSFSYDGFGNLTDVTTIRGTAPELHQGVFNPATNRTSNMTADANGNMGGPSYVYDVENRLVNTGAVAYSYSPDNKRVWRYVPGSVNEFTLWGVNGQKLATFNLGGAVQSAVGLPSTTNVWFGGRLALKNGAAVSVDNLGSRGKYYPYGGDRSGSNPVNGQEKFATYTRDAETGLDYADQRYYQPGTGMFLSPDAAPSARPGDPGRWNRYAYVGGDPINRIDPNGRDWWDVGWCDGLFCSPDWEYDANECDNLSCRLERLDQIRAAREAFWWQINVLSEEGLITRAIGGGDFRAYINWDAVFALAPVPTNTTLTTLEQLYKLLTGNPALALLAAALLDPQKLNQGEHLQPNPSRCPDKEHFNDPTKPPLPGWTWAGPDDPGGDRGAWVSPSRNESLHPDLNHPPGKDRHWDYRDPLGTFWECDENGNIILRKNQ